MENWRDIPGFEGRYQASDLGRVRSLDCEVRIVRHGVEGLRAVKGRVLRPAPHTKSGHLMVMLGRGHNRDVHVCVARAFLGEPPPGHEVLHGDSNPSHNELNNLRYGTRSENLRMDYVTGVRRVHPNFIGARWRK